MEKAFEELEKVKSKAEETIQKVHTPQKTNVIEDLRLLEQQDAVESVEKMMEERKNYNESEAVKALKQKVIQLQQDLDTQLDIKDKLIMLYINKSAHHKIICQVADSVDDLKKDLNQAKLMSKMKNDKLQNEIKELKIISEQEDQTKEEIEKLNIHANDLSTELGQLKIKYDGLRGKLVSIRENFQKIRLENLNLSSELALLKEDPLQSIKRNSPLVQIEEKNSLFRLNVLRKKCHIKRKLLTKIKIELENLKAENAHMRSQVSLDETFKIQDGGRMAKQKMEIIELEDLLSLIEDQHSCVSPIIFESSNPECRWMQAFIDKESQEANLTEDKFRIASKVLYDTSCELYDKNIETEKMRLQNLFQGEEIGDLHLKLLEMEKTEMEVLITL